MVQLVEDGGPAGTGGGPDGAPASALEELLARRHSCRAFLPDPVAPETFAAIFGLAQRTASWCNTQPWQVHLVTGEAVPEFAQHLETAVLTAPGSSDLPMPEGYAGVYADRRRASGFALYESLGIAREDKEARGLQMFRNFSFFGAPHVAVVTTDRQQGTYGAIDCGGYVANLLNAAAAHGVASCPQAAIAMYSGAVHEFLALPEDRLVVCAVALGHADPEHPVNAFRTDRAPVADVLTVVDRRPTAEETR
ncbi:MULTISPECIES: nitroreductase [unclassified Nocardioides]|uniref:nitroreductase n=1 Tax=unclassified Nocardioides TaxID=2615069 RepID=UPI0024057F40|nr:MULTISPECIES: nitroreductase [unclassified Nocardioides]